MPQKLYRLQANIVAAGQKGERTYAAHFESRKEGQAALRRLKKLLAAPGTDLSAETIAALLNVFECEGAMQMKRLGDTIHSIEMVYHGNLVQEGQQVIVLAAARASALEELRRAAKQVLEDSTCGESGADLVIPTETIEYLNDALDNTYFKGDTNAK